ncbi:hypothetical protein EOI86_23565 [Hwanghaeella grinnelliae]|uniref:VPLPA-CTERM sorting domain-containing protein n=1 Tax=Hwanghaeella grinnelliae TaxID=2500179 RepID=A0A3S2Z563_9PROT|nr:hypothetical protein [Hwanghaeella grinnelliae]RVU34097.1 hypothetical protein EOI86_23565 [Hwanghaeella grinnelliae]
MFRFLKNGLAVAAVALISLGALHDADAAVVNMDPGDSNIIVNDVFYRTQTEEKQANESFSDDYHFFLPDLNGVNGLTSVSYSYDVSFPIPVGAAAGLGIRNLTFTLTDLTNSETLSVVNLTDSNGFVMAGFESGFNFTGTWGASIDLLLTVTGQALSNGGSYNASLAAVPVPPALMLFVGALAGIGFLGRRRLGA